MSAALPFENPDSTRPSAGPNGEVTQAWVAGTEDAAAPAVAGRYRGVRFHARGGLGEVYLAEDAELPRRVALKRLRAGRATDPGSRARFLREAEITSRLEHPGIVPVYGLVQGPDGESCYAMRFIEGETLGGAAGRLHALPAGPERSRLLRQLLTRFVAVCNTLAFAHTRNVIHRDLKPQNVMLGSFGETYVIDWGLAKSLDGAPDDPVGPADARDPADTDTVQGQALGTPAFMSPEQARGDWAGLTTVSDVYGLGATLYQLLTGRPPFQGAASDVIRRVAAGETPPTARTVKDVPASLSAICQKAMAVDPAARYPGAAEVAADVERWLGDEPVSARPDSRLTRMLRWARQRPRVTAGLSTAFGVIVLGLLVAVPVLISARDRAEAATERAENATLRALEAINSEHEVFDRVFPRHSLAVSRPLEDPLHRKLRAEHSRIALRQFDALLDNIAESPRSEEELFRGYYNRWVTLVELEDPSPEQEDQRDRAGRQLKELGERLRPRIDSLSPMSRTLLVDIRTDRQRAIQEIEELVKEFPREPFPLYRLGMMLSNDGVHQYEHGQHEEAIRLLSRAVEVYEQMAALDPVQRDPRFLKGQALQVLALAQEALKRPEAPATRRSAVAMFRKLVEEDPTDLKAQERLGESLMHGSVDDRREGVRFLEEKWTLYVRNHRMPRTLQLNLIRVNQNLGKLEGELLHRQEAIRAFRRVRELGQAVEPITSKDERPEAEALASAPADLAEVMGPWDRSPEKLDLYDEALRRYQAVEKAFGRTDGYSWPRGYINDSKGMELARRERSKEADAAYRLGARYLEEAAQRGSKQERRLSQFHLLLCRAHLLQLEGKDAEAAALLEPLAKEWKEDADQLHLLGIEQARCAACVGKAPADQKRREEYIAEAVRLFQQARKLGDKDQEDLQRNPDLDILRSRSDFQALTRP